jgi:hypothetical protein
MERRAELLERAKAKKRAKEEADAASVAAAAAAVKWDPSPPMRSYCPPASAAPASPPVSGSRSPARQAVPDGTALERELLEKGGEVARWRQAAAMLRDEKRELGAEIERLGAANEQLQRRVDRSALDGEAVQDEIALRERETRRAEKFRRLGEPFL